MKRKARLFLYFLGLFLFPLLTPYYLFAQNASFQKLTKQDGLPSNSIYGLLEDHKGYIWIYTNKGISKYDGYEFQNFGLQDGLPALDTWRMNKDSKERLWVYTFKGLAYIENDSVCAISIAPPQLINSTDIYEQNDTLWTVHNKHRFLLQNDSLLLQAEQLFPTNINTLSYILNTPNSALGLVNNTMITYDLAGEIIKQSPIDTSWINTLFYSNQQMINPEIVNIVPNTDGILFLTPLGVGKWFYNGEKSIALSFKEKFNLPIDNNRMPQYTEGLNGQIQLTIAAGLIIEMDQQLNIKDHFRFETGKKNNNAYKDREGNIWIATTNNGLYIKAAQARNTTVFVEPNDERILSLICDFQGNVFYGTDNGGIFHFQDGISTRLIPKSKLGTDVNDLLLTPNGHLFFGARKDIFQLNTNAPKNAWKARSLSDDFVKNFSGDMISYYELSGRNIYEQYRVNNLKSLAWDKNKNTLYFSMGSGLIKFDFTTFNQPFVSDRKFSRVTSMVFEDDGSMWVGAMDGLKKIEKDTVIDKTKLHPLLQKNIVDMAMDKAGILWIGTEGNGIFGFREDSIYYVPSTTRDFVLSVLVDYENKLWIGTDNGVKQFDLDPTQLGKTQLIKTYSLADGLLASEVNDIAVDSQYVYFGTNQGLVKIKKTNDQTGAIKPLLYLKSVQINTVDVPLDSVYHLRYDENELSIEYTGISYQSFGKLSYQYQLEHVDKDWQTTNTRQVRYPKLAPGSYTFRLKVTDSDGVETVLQQPISFVIAPPFWATTWFRLLSIAAVLGSLWFIYTLRLRRAIAKEAEQTAINKKFAELELQALQSQMNPHFVFNSLASIQYFIQENNVDEAEDYLAKFAKLMRRFLESSKTKYTTLEEDLNLLQLYIEMEQMRFEDRFDIHIEGPSDFDILAIKIPTMVLQPFVENAIHHGLFHKKEKGILTLKYHRSADEKQLICIIQDNGIGRTAAAKIKQKSIKSYQSRGMQIVEERLSVLRDVEKYNIHIDIIDLFHTFGKSLGTKVIINIPILD